MDAITLQVPTKKFKQMLGVTTGMLVLSGVMLLEPWVQSWLGFRIALYFCILFLIVFAVFFVLRLLWPAPMLVIDDKGLTDNASALGAGFIAWRDIERIEFVVVMQQDYLAIHAVDMDSVLARYNPLKRAIMRINGKLAGTPFLLPMQGLSLSREQLRAAIDPRLAASAG